MGRSNGGIIGTASPETFSGVWDLSEVALQLGSDVWPSLGTWVVDLSNVTYDNKFYNASSLDGNIRSVCISPDGTKMIVVGLQSAKVFQIDMSVPFNLSVGVYVSEYSVQPNPTEAIYSSDGTKMFVLGLDQDVIGEYNLSTPYVLSTASFVRNFFVGLEDSQPSGIHFSLDGLNLYLCGFSSGRIHQYSLTNPFDLSTASYTGKNYFISPGGLALGAVFLNPQGTKMYLADQGGGAIYQYTLATPFDMSTTSYDSVFASIPEEGDANGIHFSPDGTKMFVAGRLTDSVYRYSTGL